MRAVREHDGYFLVCCIYIFKWTTYKDHEGRLLPNVPEYTIQAFLMMSYFKIVSSVWTGFFFVFDNFLIILNLVSNLFSELFI